MSSYTGVNGSSSSPSEDPDDAKCLESVKERPILTVNSHPHGAGISDRG